MSLHPQSQIKPSSEIFVVLFSGKPESHWMPWDTWLEWMPVPDDGTLSLGLQLSHEPWTMQILFLSVCFVRARNSSRAVQACPLETWSWIFIVVFNKSKSELIWSGIAPCEQAQRHKFILRGKQWGAAEHNYQTTFFSSQCVHIKLTLIIYYKGFFNSKHSVSKSNRWV